MEVSVAQKPEQGKVSTSEITVRPVCSARDLKTFIKLPFRLYRDSRHWVPPLIAERKRFLNRSKNPFFKHAEAEYFLAERNGRVVGRIVACIDDFHEQAHGSADGYFGFFECEDDPELARLLVETAASWLEERGRVKMIGPMEFSTNDECGLLIDGHELDPYVLMPYHHRYYQRLLEDQGLTKAMDLLQWELSSNELDFLPVLEELAEKSVREHNVTIRPLKMKDFQQELKRFFDLYNSAWERNWGYVPMTEEELKFRAKDTKAILAPSLALFAEKDGEVVGGALSLPNINEVLPRLKGRLLPFGWLKFLLGKRKIKSIRVVTLGVKHQYQHTGIAAALYIHTRDNGLVMGIERGEMGWVLETNEAMNKAMEAMGGKVVKRYRIYERLL